MVIYREDTRKKRPLLIGARACLEMGRNQLFDYLNKPINVYATIITSMAINIS
ncbi:hypothetical protein ACPOM7_25110 [Peribacillus castrilensis]|uniref:hypothetical protein n=1 Tax=Bacillaceae TaxID=186817 RepID=UPI000B206CCC|nr:MULTISPECIES: hypothetical protein [Bacillaceae]MCP1094747.1 hypothetical protein [Bacillaceae bacterium OS4b]MBD8588834.1 hypothetical protein [Peribacillus simplex]MCF7624597.1 hypothetical protein [Peribacillus frigoritolerans]MCP1155137.1 hypothetical protein [Peribacillus frigoritolerans]MCT1391076.1 hypothetical protein [Peribacillus frigoritolerans]